MMTLGELALAVLKTKETKKPTTYAIFKFQVERIIVPHFGHLKPKELTVLKWEQFLSDQRGIGKRTHFNGLKRVLINILHHALDEGLIEKIPKLKDYDPEPAPPRYITDEQVIKIIHASKGLMKLFVLIMWKQGGRPREVLQYKYSNIDTGGVLSIGRETTKTNRGRLIPLNSSVLKAINFSKKFAVSDYIFPDPKDQKSHLRNYKTAWNTVMKKLGYDFTPYNLRDTFITNALRRGMSAAFIGKYCDNSALMIDKKYSAPTNEMLKKIAG